LGGGHVFVDSALGNGTTAGDLMLAQSKGMEPQNFRRERFGVDHVDVGVWLARRWTLPESIVDVIGRHHEAPAGPLDHVKVVQIACRLADLLGFGVNRPSELPDFSDISGSLPEGTRLRLSAQLPL
jgi:HD-like signal output (HDOD) protein